MIHVRVSVKISSLSNIHPLGLIINFINSGNISSSYSSVKLYPLEAMIFYFAWKFLLSYDYYLFAQNKKLEWECPINTADGKVLFKPIASSSLL